MNSSKFTSCFSLPTLFSFRDDIWPTSGPSVLLGSWFFSGYHLNELIRAGERIIDAERLFSVKVGFSRKDDTPSLCILRQSLPNRPARGMVCHLEEMITEYYELRGWEQNVIATYGKLKELGLA